MNIFWQTHVQGVCWRTSFQSAMAPNRNDTTDGRHCHSLVAAANPPRALIDNVTEIFPSVLGIKLAFFPCSQLAELNKMDSIWPDYNISCIHVPHSFFTINTVTYETQLQYPCGVKVTCTKASQK